jgi:hypothetical protein
LTALFVAHHAPGYHVGYPNPREDLSALQLVEGWRDLSERSPYVQGKLLDRFVDDVPVWLGLVSAGHEVGPQAASRERARSKLRALSPISRVELEPGLVQAAPARARRLLSIARRRIL